MNTRNSSINHQQSIRFQFREGFKPHQFMQVTLTKLFQTTFLLPLPINSDAKFCEKRNTFKSYQMQLCAQKLFKLNAYFILAGKLFWRENFKLQFKFQKIHNKKLTVKV